MGGMVKSTHRHGYLVQDPAGQEEGDHHAAPYQDIQPSIHIF